MAVKDERLGIRMTSEQLELIREAAAVEGRSVSDFATSALTSHANDVLADQRLFRLDDASWTALTAALDRPAAHRPKLSEALRRHAEEVNQG